MLIIITSSPGLSPYGESGLKAIAVGLLGGGIGVFPLMGKVD